MKTGKVLTLLLAAVTMTVSLPIHAIAMIGDLNNDGVVDKQDAKILTEYFAGYDRNFDRTSADVDADGQLTRKDGMILNRYTDGWDGYGIATEEEAAAAIYTQALDEEHVQTATLTYEGESYESMYVDNEILVVVDEDQVGRDYVEALVEPYHGTVVGQVPVVGFYQVEIDGAPTLSQLNEAIDALTTAEYVEDAYLNTVTEYETNAYYPNDPYNVGDSLWDDSINTWHLRATHVPEAWELVYSVEKNPSVVMGIIDDNFDENHKDLNINILSRHNENLTGTTDPRGAFHGTHVAGILGAITNNKRGVSGIAINPTVYCIAERKKAYQRDETGYLTSLADLIRDYSTMITQGCQNGNHMIINMSLSGYEAKKTKSISKTLLDLENEGYEFLITVSAGNSGTDPSHSVVTNSILTAITEPSVVDNIIVVGNADADDGEDIRDYADFINGFERNDSSSYIGERVDIMAPGTLVYSTTSTEVDGILSRFDPIDGDGYVKLTGTSMASPVVAGVAALVWEANPDLSPEQVKDFLIRTADIPVDGNGDDNCPNMVNAKAAVEAAILMRDDIDDYSKLSAYVTDTDGAIANATIQFILKANGTITATSERFTTDDKGATCRFFKTDKQYTHAVIVADGYKVQEIALTDDILVMQGNLLHYSLGEVRMEKAPTTHTVSGTALPAGVTVACSYGSAITTDDTGHYSFALPDGTYTLTFMLDGYETTTRTVTVNGSDYTIDTVTMVAVEEEDIIASGTCGMDGDNVTWTLDDSYALTVTGTGEMADYSYTADNLAPWSRYREQITSITIGEGITDTGAFTFYYCQNVPGTITIPDGVQTIGKCSFEGCKKVTGYNIPATVQQIDGFAFKDNTNLQSFVIPDGVTSIGEETFQRCTNLASLHIPEGVTSIGYSAFADCYALTSLTLPESLISVGATAFWNVGFVGTLRIPKNVNSIGYNAFYCNYDLEAFVVDPDNTLLMSQDGVLFTHDQTELIQYPRGKTDTTYVIPDSVQTIGRLGMAQNGYIHNVILPDTLQVIGEYAFWASAITSITIPASVTKLDSRAFDYCDSLTDIYFCGDVPTTCGEYIARSANLTIHYIEGRSGWTTPTWTSPDGTVYNTAIWNP